MKGETKVLDYHDVLLYQSDLDLLTGPYWLNDQVLHHCRSTTIVCDTCPDHFRAWGPDHRVLLRVPEQGRVHRRQHFLLQPFRHLPCIT